jgi:Holliday junction resolvasome RuvABC endonuclease subunit
MKNVLGFDLGSKCGWAFSAGAGEAVHSGLLKTTPTRFESQGMRAVKFEKGVLLLMTTFKPDFVAFEEVRRHSSTIAGQVWGLYSGILMKLCEERGITYAGYGVGTIKKHATGKGNASKELMIGAAEVRWPEQDIITDDVADALHIMALGLTQ